MLNIAITTGEPAGIGPEISLRVAKKFLSIHADVCISLIGDVDLLSGVSSPRLSIDTYRDWETDRKSTRLNSSHSAKSRMPSSA